MVFDVGKSSPSPQGVIQDGSGNTGYFLKVNADGSINVSGGGGGGNTTVTAASVTPTWTDGSTNNAITGNLHGAIYFIPTTPAGAVVDLSQPSGILGTNGSSIAAPGNPLDVEINGTVPLPTGAATNAELVTINTTLGTPFQAGASIGNTSFAATQATASALNAQVVGNVATGSTDSGNAVKVGGLANTTPPSVSAGQRIDLAMDTSGNARTLMMAAFIAGADSVNNNNIATITQSNSYSTTGGLRIYPWLFNGTSWDRQRTIGGSFGSALGVTAVETAGSSFGNMTTATTTTHKSGAGILHKIIVNTLVASATITVFDNTAGSGTKIATITLPSTITGDQPFALTYDLSFATGLTITTSGGTDLTVVYR
jgi:hypothetical protein